MHDNLVKHVFCTKKLYVLNKIFLIPDSIPASKTKILPNPSISFSLFIPCNLFSVCVWFLAYIFPLHKSLQSLVRMVTQHNFKVLTNSITPNDQIYGQVSFVGIYQFYIWLCHIRKNINKILLHESALKQPENHDMNLSKRNICKNKLSLGLI